MILMQQAPKGKFCKSCAYFDHTTDDKKAPFCWVCADIQQKVTPVAFQNNIQNGNCFQELNKNNDCPFYSQSRGSDKQLDKLRITCKLKMAK